MKYTGKIISTWTITIFQKLLLGQEVISSDFNVNLCNTLAPHRSIVNHFDMAMLAAFVSFF